jgi:hypothetical protein
MSKYCLTDDKPFQPGGQLVTTPHHFVEGGRQSDALGYCVSRVYCTQCGEIRMLDWNKASEKH